MSHPGLCGKEFGECKPPCKLDESIKVILVRENGNIRVLEGKGVITAQAMALRTRLTSGEIEYFELDYDEKIGCPLEGYVAVLNMYPELLAYSKSIKPIDRI